MLDYYQILDVSPSATQKEIVAAYRAKCKKLQYLEREIMKRKLEGKDMSFEKIVERYLKEIFVDTSTKSASSKPSFEGYRSVGYIIPFTTDEDKRT